MEVIEGETKRCSKCGEVKGVEEYYFRKSGPQPGKPLGRCKICQKRADAVCRDRRRADLRKYNPDDESKCAGCGEVKRNADFGKCVSRPKGIDTYCKECKKKASRRRAEETARTRESVSNLTCRSCGKTKSAADFTKDSHRSTGHKPDCKACVQLSRFVRKLDLHLGRHILARLEAHDKEAARERRRLEWEATAPEREARRLEKQREKDKRRRRKKRTKQWPSIFEVGEKDGWVCGVCGKHVDKDLEWLAPWNDRNVWAPSRDHIVPRAAGGGNELSNFQITHFICNSYKRDLGEDASELKAAIAYLEEYQSKNDNEISHA